MAAISAFTPTSSVVSLMHLQNESMACRYILGLPPVAKMGKVRCSMEGKPQETESKLGMGASLTASTCAAAMSSPAMALVDERMSTEGTGLPFGLSNNLLGWIIFGIFGLIWTLYIIYASGLEEDEDSGLSL
ncbi:photosystem II reaction center W protein, chloroplastic-like [Olea europaea var. sylvestris]|uniref:PSII 6.1 kDa protein n=1 Tax=Olea europaea subsp. europaea TaxID=158383 RepID=A0A8S0R9F5_OLEEU|nr:photosystem II reaction center W protein, chloroplastic-like [Olea europaea var. sylvestris]CAA2975710.1 chloroplast photosystem II [Olea europaea subsp. europaea]